MIKGFYECIVGSVMANRMIIYVPYTKDSLEYNERIEIIEKTRTMIRKLRKYIDVKFRAGIGSVVRLEECLRSYE